MCLEERAGGSGATGMMKKDAVIEGPYRYSLTRTWDESKPRVLFVMLNPSTSDNEKDGYTVKRCIGFAERWGYGSVEIVNLYAYRSKDAMALNDVDDPIGSRNREHILAALHQAERVILAWGEEIQSVTNARDALYFLEECAQKGQDYYCLGLTKKGNPKLPSKLSYSTELRKVTLHRDGSSVYLNQWGVTGEQASLADYPLTSEGGEPVQQPTTGDLDCLRRLHTDYGELTKSTGRIRSFPPMASLLVVGVAPPSPLICFESGLPNHERLQKR